MCRCALLPDRTVLEQHLHDIEEIADSMIRFLKYAFGLVGIVLGALFFAFWITIFLVPLWRWIEADFGVEAIGHSGPAEWCFYLVFTVLVLPALYFMSRVWRRGRAQP
jgi:hypothetical protein